MNTILKHNAVITILNHHQHYINLSCRKICTSNVHLERNDHKEIRYILHFLLYYSIYYVTHSLNYLCTYWRLRTLQKSSMSKPLWLFIFLYTSCIHIKSHVSISDHTAVSPAQPRHLTCCTSRWSRLPRDPGDPESQSEANPWRQPWLWAGSHVVFFLFKTCFLFCIYVVLLWGFSAPLPPML